jgi:uncharacterized integral membrane protein (TIGR00698 family)
MEALYIFDGSDRQAKRIYLMMNFYRELKKEVTEGWMGLHLVFGLAVLGRFFHGLIDQPLISKSVSEILVAILLGLYVGNTFRLGKEIQAGAKFALQRLLRLGIILLGLRLSLQDVAATGVTALVLVTVCITIALGMAYVAGHLFKVPPRLAALIGVGTAICGNTAIVATAPVIEADEQEMGFAVATITLFGMLAVVVYPLIGQLTGLSDYAFGLWAGTAVNDTSQVVAVGAIYSEAALNIATIVKLTRNTLMAPIIVLIGILYGRSSQDKSSNKTKSSSRLNLGKIVPGFVFGFLLMAMVRTLGIAFGILPQNVAQPGDLELAANLLRSVDELSKFLILMALAGVGLNTNLDSLRRLGLKPLLVGTSVAVLLAVLSLTLILFSPLGA